MTSSAVCVACRHAIDDAAKVCPYCGADPHTGKKLVDTQAILHEVFQPKKLTATQGVMQYAQRQESSSLWGDSRCWRWQDFKSSRARRNRSASKRCR
jgi:hypothetical protein